MECGYHEEIPMKYALFIGCNIPARVQQYETSARAVLADLDVEIIDDPPFKCCGNPIRNTDNDTWLLMAAYNLALAQDNGTRLVVLCKCCFGSLKKAAYLLDKDMGCRVRVNTLLSRDGLEYAPGMEIKHFLSVLYHDIGVDVLKEKITRSFKDLDIATHYGCHALRPSEVTEFDNPVAPVLFDELVAATGANSIDWPLKLTCCGAPVLGIQDSLSMDLTQRKMNDAIRAGANFLCMACPFCQMQFSRIDSVPGIIYPQLLGLAMGLEKDALGFNKNDMNYDSLESYLA